MPKRSTRKRRALRPRLGPRPDNDFAGEGRIAAWARARCALLPNVHPGELLWEVFMQPCRLTPEMLAAAIPRHPEIPDSDIAEQIRDLVQADEDSLLDLPLALALDRYFGLSPGYFWRVQAGREIRDWSRRDHQWLARIKPFRKP
jgi:plasmid maintenance system antidote protein VapI